MNQTLKDIEIICVDDGSSDGSARILKQYADADSRVISIHHTENMGTLITRKDGVMASKGMYVMFIDADDWYEPNACEVAYGAIETNKTDVLQFGVKIENAGGESEKLAQGRQRWWRVNTNRISGDNLIAACWRDNKIKFTLCNRIFNGDICRKAFSEQRDGYVVCAEDLFAFLTIAYYSSSYIGIGTVLYHYNIGIGVTAGEFLTLNQFRNWLSECNILDLIDDFFENKEDRDSYSDIIESLRYKFVSDCVNKWCSALSVGVRPQAFTELVRTWGYEDVISTFADTYWDKRCELAEVLTDVYSPKKYSRVKDEEAKTIAFCYKRIYDGGIERVVAKLCCMLADRRDANGNNMYHVVLICDEAPNELDYELDPRVDREYLLLSQKAIGADYRDRFRGWNKIIDKYQPDIVVSSLWMEPCLLFDMLTVKGHRTPPAFILHTHSFCCVPFRYTTDRGNELTHIYKMCDGVVTLSESDRLYASVFSDCVRRIENPVDYCMAAEKLPEYNGDTLVWVGRIVKDKRPFDIVRLMDILVKEHPDVKVYVVGQGDAEIIENLRKMISSYGLDEHIILTGYVQNVEEYNNKASICVVTSEYDGYLVEIYEAMAHGLPIVLYDIPWLSCIEDGRGIITVPQRRYDIMAERILDLLKNKEKWHIESDMSRAHAMAAARLDIAGKWDELFDAVIENKRDDCDDSNWKKVISQLTACEQIGRVELVRNYQNSNAKLQKTYAEKSEINAKLQQTYAEKSEINAKLQQTYAEKAERGIEIKKLKSTVTDKEKEISALTQRVDDYERENAVQKEKIAELEKKIDDIENSTSYKVGFGITKLPRKIKDRMRK